MMLTNKVLAALMALLLLLAIVPLTAQNSPIIAQEEENQDEDDNGNGDGDGNGNGVMVINNGDQNTKNNPLNQHNCQYFQQEQPVLGNENTTTPNGTQPTPTTEATLPVAPPVETTNQLGVSVSAEQAAIQRGKTQNVNVLTTDPNTIYFGIMTYASKSQALFLGFTDSSGTDDQQFKINRHAKPGTFTVEILAISNDGQFASADTQFIVYKRGQIPIPPER